MFLYIVRTPSIILRANFPSASTNTLVLSLSPNVIAAKRTLNPHPTDLILPPKQETLPIPPAYTTREYHASLNTASTSEVITLLQGSTVRVLTM